MFVISCALNNMQWIQYSVIADVIVKHYNISYAAVNWTSMVFLLCYGIFVLPAIYFSETHGLRKSILLSTTLTCVGSWIKIFSVKNDKFWLVLVGQSIVALSAVFLVSAPAAIAATWFGSTEVSLACSVGLNGVLIGVAIGCLIPSFAVSAEDDFEKNLYIMLLTIATIATVVLILQFFFFADRPRYAPSKAQLKQLLIKHETTQFFKSIFRLIKKLPYLFHLVGFGVTYGISCSIIGLLNQFVSSYYENAAVDAGRIGVVLILMGIVGSVSCGILLDKFNRYKVTYLVLQCGYIVAMLVFTYTLEKGISIIYITAGLIGLFMGSVQPVASEAAIEFTYPESEGVVVGLLFGSAQIFGVAFTYIHSELLYAFGVIWANNCVSLALFIVLIIIFCIPFKYNRYSVNFSKNEIKI